MKGALSRPEKIRILIFAVLHLFFVFLVLGWSVSVCGVWHSIPYREEGMLVDGQYFPPLLSNAAIAVTNGVIGFISAVVYVLLTIIMTCVSILPFSLISTGKITAVSALELKLTKVLLFSWIAVYAAGLILTGTKSWFYALILMAAPAAAEILFYARLKRLFCQN